MLYNVTLCESLCAHVFFWCICLTNISKEKRCCINDEDDDDGIDDDGD